MFKKKRARGPDSEQISRELLLPPGEKIRSLAHKSKIARFFTDKFGILPLAEDVYFMWMEAASNEEKHAAHAFYRSQLIRAIPGTIVAEIGLVGALHSHPFILISYVIALPITGAILFYLFRR